MTAGLLQRPDISLRGEAIGCLLHSTSHFSEARYQISAAHDYGFTAMAQYWSARRSKSLLSSLCEPLTSRYRQYAHKCNATGITLGEDDEDYLVLRAIGQRGPRLRLFCNAQILL